MASDSFRTVTRKGWLSRLGNSVVGVLIGIIAIIGLPIMLFWNEGRAVQTARSLDEGAGLVVSIDAGAVDPGNAGRLVHLSGPLELDGELTDSLTGTSALAVRLDRVVEMYQWVETCESSSKTQVGGGEETVTTCRYSRDWRAEPVNSARFRQPSGHENPVWTLQPQAFKADSARLGAFSTGRAILDQLGDSERLPVAPEAVEIARRQLGSSRPVSLVDGQIYLAADPLSSVVGDLRIGYRMVPGGVISAIGRQEGSGLDHYQTRSGDALLMVARGAATAAAMFRKAQDDNVLLTWILRAVGLIGLTIGFALLLGPLAVVADVVPPVGALLRLGSGAVALVLALVLGGLVIGIAWLWYRPLLGIAILAATLALGWLAVRRGAARPAAAPVPAGQGAQ